MTKRVKTYIKTNVVSLAKDPRKLNYYPEELATLRDDLTALDRIELELALRAAGISTPLDDLLDVWTGAPEEERSAEE